MLLTLQNALRSMDSIKELVCINVSKPPYINQNPNHMSSHLKFLF